MRKIVIFLFLLAFACFANAGTISSVVVYGDSLSDNGNLFALAGQPPSPPYYMGRRSNGPVAVEQLASVLGVPLHDFAFIGATTGIGNYADAGTPTSMGAFLLPGMQAEFNDTSPLVPGFGSGALFVVWGGPNDFLSPSPLDATAVDVANRAVADIIGIVTGLQSLGAQNILVPDMPDLGLTPYIQSLGPAAVAQGSAITNYFNAKLLSDLPAGVIFFDTASLMRSIVANPAAFGFTNVTDPCLESGAVCANPDQYLFFDDFHPSAAAHAILGQHFAAAVPEPATCVLVLSGVMVALRKKRLLKM